MTTAPSSPPWDTLAFDRFRTRRFTAAALVPADADPLVAVTDDPGIGAAVDFLPHPFGPDDALALIDRQRGGRDRFFAVRDGAGTLLAVAGAHLQGTDRVEIGYWVATSWHGRGVATEVADALVDALAHHHPDRCIVAECHPENTASWSVLRKCGFVPAGGDGHRPGRKLLVRDPGRRRL